MKKKINFKKITLEKLAAIVSEKLKEHEIDSVLVGGGCVSIYSRNRYESYDLDYVTHEDMKTVEKALLELDFIKNEKYFCHTDCDYFIEFVSPPVSIGDEAIHKFEYHKTPLGTIKMLTPTDSVKDRLAGFYHWGDRQSLDQAVMICNEIPNKIDLDKIKRWSN
ncbi:MAG: nucleotidyltransferase, partial [Chlamydiales bacterium]